MKSFLHYIRTGLVTENDDSFVKRIHEAVVSARAHEEWRVEYMTLLMRDAENVEKGRQKGRRGGIEERRKEGNPGYCPDTCEQCGFCHESTVSIAG